MTLIINAITHRYCLQVADTRLTKEGSLFDDNAIKTTIVYCTNAIAVISYTGLAFFGNIRTDRWIVEQLTSIKSWEKNLKQVLDCLQEAATTQINKIAVANKHHTFSITGWYQSKTIPKPFFVSVTNCEDENMTFLAKPLDHFEIRTLTLKPGAETFSNTHAVVIQGTEAATTEAYSDRRLRKSIKQIITNKNSDRDKIITNIVSFLRIAAKHKDYGKYIGKKCVSVYLKVDEGIPTTQYHSTGGNKKEYAPNLVSNGVGFVGVEIEVK